MNEKREFQSPVSISELTNRVEQSDAIQTAEIVGRLRTEATNQTVQDSDVLPDQVQLTGEVVTRKVRTKTISRAEKLAKRQEMLRRFEEGEKAAA